MAQDDVQAVAWWRKAAEQGDAQSQYNLGWMYENGRGVGQDSAQAVAWYRKAAEQGDVNAQYRLGWMYENGHGVIQDDVQAAVWFRKATEQDIQDIASLNNRILYEAYRNTKILYQSSLGVGQDDAEAPTQYQKSTEKGDTNAQKNLAGLTSQGKNQEGATQKVTDRRHETPQSAAPGSDQIVNRVRQAACSITQADKEAILEFAVRAPAAMIQCRHESNKKSCALLRIGVGLIDNVKPVFCSHEDCIRKFLSQKMVARMSDLLNCP